MPKPCSGCWTRSGRRRRSSSTAGSRSASRRWSPRSSVAATRSRARATTERRLRVRGPGARGEGPAPFYEIPISSIALAGLALPIAGGNFLRQLPTWLVERGLARWDADEAAPLVFYFHLWELDPDQPRLALCSRRQRLRRYRNLEVMGQRVRAVLERYRFTSIRDHLGLPDVAAPAAPDPAAARPVRARALGKGTPLAIVVPCYNEAANLPYLANALDVLAERIGGRHRLSHVLVDDGSVDGTWDEMRRLFGDRPGFRLVRHAANRGVAAATLTGLAAAETDTVAVIDSDCSYDPLQIERMLPLLTPETALVTASPYHAKGRVENVPAWRLLLSRGLSRLYQVVLRHKLQTYTSCFRIYRRSALDGLALRDGGFIGVTEILVRLDLQGARVVECPAVLEARLLGQSKMRVLRTIAGHLRLLAELLALRARRNLSGGTPPDLLTRGERA